jgi:hypothetical protein
MAGKKGSGGMTVKGSVLDSLPVGPDKASPKRRKIDLPTGTPFDQIEPQPGDTIPIARTVLEEALRALVPFDDTVDRYLKLYGDKALAAALGDRDAFQRDLTDIPYQSAHPEEVEKAARKAKKTLKDLLKTDTEEND